MLNEVKHLALSERDSSAGFTLERSEGPQNDTNHLNHYSGFYKKFTILPVNRSATAGVYSDS